MKDYHSEEGEGESSDSNDSSGRAGLERDYWDMVETSSRHTSVEYANDLDIGLFGSGFPVLLIYYFKVFSFFHLFFSFLFDAALRYLFAIVYIIYVYIVT
jgi:hypothetical protein